MSITLHTLQPRDALVACAPPVSLGTVARPHNSGRGPAIMIHRAPQARRVCLFLAALCVILGATRADRVIAQSSGCPCSIWTPAAAPSNPAVSDGQPIEVGVKFRSDVDGFVTAIRFYKGTANVGSHVGHLWSGGGALLAEATFTSESASGWQEVALSPAVAITANTTYVASYHADSGFFAFDSGFF